MGECTLIMYEFITVPFDWGEGYCTMNFNCVGEFLGERKCCIK